MTLEFDLFFSFRSPYSYLAVPRLVALARDFDVNVNFRPVYPIAVRSKDFFTTVNPMWPPYLIRDAFRLAEMLGLTFKWPNPDPIVQDLGTMQIAEDQPYIHRLTRLGQAAADQGKGLAFADEVGHLTWGGVTDWHQGDHLAGAAEKAGLDLAAMDAAVEADPEGYDAKIEANQDALKAAGHWGVPTMVFDGEPFFGQDRIDLLIWRLKQNGLTERAA